MQNDSFPRAIVHDPWKIKSIRDTIQHLVVILSSLLSPTVTLIITSHSEKAHTKRLTCFWRFSQPTSFCGRSWMYEYSSCVCDCVRATVDVYCENRQKQWCAPLECACFHCVHNLLCNNIIFHYSFFHFNPKKVIPSLLHLPAYKCRHKSTWTASSV